MTESTSGATHILLTIDVEDWFQVENLKGAMPFSSWPSQELRVERNVHTLLDSIDSASSCNDGVGPSEKTRATFFVLGWIAERLPHVVREIHARGHEIASHGFRHDLCNTLTSSDLRNDLSDSKKLLEDITGSAVFGYRAPSFSISEETLKIVEDCGYMYDSSFNSLSLNKRYGQIDLSKFTKKGIAARVSGCFYEVPISNLGIGKRVIPWGGGGYFRLIPLPVFTFGVELILKRENAYVFYIHPWEIDPGQPRVTEVSALHRFRHYHNLDKNSSRFRTFLKKIPSTALVSCKEYLGIE